MSRAISFLLVVAMHLLAIACLERMTYRSDKSLGRPAQMVLVMVERDEVRRERQLDVPVPLKQPSVPRPKLNPIPETLRPPDSSANESAGALVDWRAEGEKAAKSVARSASERKPMTSAPPASEVDAPRSTVFGSILENQRAGKAEILEDVERVFVTNNCYFDFEFARGSVDLRPKDTHIPKIRCAPPPTGGGANMFKHLTPEYLEGEKGDETSGR